MINFVRPVYARASRSAWLWRCLVIEGIFLAFFSNWYASRYFHLKARLPFFSMVVVIILLSGLVIAGGIWADRRKIHRLKNPN